jgi:hypothetical protein
MTTSTYLIRSTRLLALGAVVAGTVASVAGAYNGRPPDVQDAMAALHTTPAGVKADGLRLQGIAQVYQERLAVPNSAVAEASRPPDISDASLAVQYGSVGRPNIGFDWGDWSIGLMAGFGLALAVAGGALLASHRIARIGRTGATAAG